MSDSVAIGPNWKKISIPIDTLFAALAPQQIALFAVNKAGIADWQIVVDDITLTSGYPTAIQDACTTNCIPQMYPTLVQNNITIDIPNANTQKYSTKIYNTLGQLVQSNLLQQANHQTLDCSALPTGDYMLQCNSLDGTKRSTFRFSKQ